MFVPIAILLVLRMYSNGYKPYARAQYDFYRILLFSDEFCILTAYIVNLRGWACILNTQVRFRLQESHRLDTHRRINRILQQNAYLAPCGVFP